MAPEVFFFQNKTVEIKRRAFKRTIGVTLQVSGKILVSAPKMVPLRRIHQFLEKNQEWIETNFQKYDELRRLYPKKTFSAGESFLFLGERLTLKFAPGQHKRVKIIRSVNALNCILPEDLYRNFDQTSQHPELEKAFLNFYEGEGRAHLSERISHFSDQMKLYPKAVSYRSQKTRWGSCSSQGKLSFNWRLIIAPLAVIDYVIVHELAHLKYHNHSKNFWSLVAEHCADYRECRNWLKQNQFEADFLSKASELHG